MNRGVLIFVIFLLLSTNSFALITTVSSNKPSDNLNHGQSTTVSFEIKHDNSWCNVDCSYYLKDINSGKIVESNYIILTPTQNRITKTYTVYAPSKISGGDSGALQYEFSSTCSDKSSLVCFTSETDTDDALFVLNYDLTIEEKNAKNYLETNLDALKTKLETLEKSIYNLKTRINDLDTNVLVGTIPSSVSGIESNFKVLKSNRDAVKSYYDAHDYIDGKSVFKESWITNSEAYNDNIDDLSSELDDIIKKHNEVAASINALSKNLDELGKDSKVLKEETRFNQLSQSISSLSNKFKSGNFASYESLENEINSINIQVTEFKNLLNSLSNSLITELTSLIKSEYASLCSEKDYCKDSPTISNKDAGQFIEEFCSDKLNIIKNDFETGNRVAYEKYLVELDQIKAENMKISIKNEKLKKYYNATNLLIIFLNNNIVKINIDNCINVKILDKSPNEIDKLIENCNELSVRSQTLVQEKQGFVYSVKLFFKRINPFSKIRIKEEKYLEQIEEPLEPIDLDFSEGFKDASSKYCSINLELAPRSYSNVDLADNPEGDTLSKTSISELTKQTSKCCTFGVCRECCEGDECLNDVKTFPIIFLHGHSFAEWNSPEYSLDAFNQMISSLKDEGFISAGTITPSSTSGTKGGWGKSGAPVMIKTTYYYGVYNVNGQLISRPSKSERIEEYATRLKSMIDKIKYKTNRNKVIIVAHSMGGLVSREYIKEYGDDSVYKLIMIGTPNHGVYGDVKDFCSNFLIFNLGADVECEQMAYDSTFISSLNSGDETLGELNYYTIRGSGCILSGIDGDGIVRTTSVPLDGATNYEIKGQCSGAFNRDFHSELLNPSKYPEVLTKVKGIIKR